MEPADPPSVARTIDRQWRGRGRLQKGALVFMALVILSCCSWMARTAVLNTDPWAAVRADAAFNLILALLSMPVMLLLAAVGFCGAKFLSRQWSAEAGFPPWMAGIVVPLLAAVVFVGWAGLDRVFPGRLFQKYTGQNLPEGAKVIALRYDDTLLETHLELEFSAPVSGMRELVRELGVQTAAGTGKESFDPISVNGDYGSLEVDWDRGVAVFTYLDV